MSSFSFSSIEIRDIIVSVLVLTVVFAYPDFIENPLILGVYFLIVLVAFMGHELSHKFTAIKLGFASEFRMWRQGLMLALFMALATGGRMLFAAPGAVYFGSRWAFQSHPTRRDVGLIGASGPAFNIFAGAVSLLILMVTGFSVFLPLIMFNSWLAIFNLIPFGPLDGAKIFRWNMVIWAAMLISSLSLYGFVVFV